MKRSNNTAVVISVRLQAYLQLSRFGSPNKQLHNELVTVFVSLAFSEYTEYSSR